MRDLDIEHNGVVLSVVGNRVDVSVLAASGCGSCAVKGVCGMSETKEKVVSIVMDHPNVYLEGDEVVVSVKRSMGMKAVVLAYVIPLLSMCVALMTMLSVGISEVIAGLSALGVVVLYYVVLYFMRDRIERQIVFKLKQNYDI